jgi:tetratricopeptide (TPR) repeat protein
LQNEKPGLYSQVSWSFNAFLRRCVLLALALSAVFLVGATFGNHSWKKERTLHRLVTGSEKDKAVAARQLVELGGEAQLLRALHADSETTRALATQAVWMLWLQAGGDEAYGYTVAANEAIQRRAFGEALTLLSELTVRHPQFAEGWNRRATLLWQLGYFEESIADCRQVIALNPVHFGAWQGMGLSHIQLGDLAGACACFRVALQITPHSRALQGFLRLCDEADAPLPDLSPVPRVYSL